MLKELLAIGALMTAGLIAIKIAALFTAISETDEQYRQRTYAADVKAMKKQMRDLEKR